MYVKCVTMCLAGLDSYLLHPHLSGHAKVFLNRNLGKGMGAVFFVVLLTWCTLLLVLKNSRVCVLVNLISPLGQNGFDE